MITYEIGCSTALSGVERQHGLAVKRAAQIALKDSKAELDLPFDLTLNVVDDGADEDAGRQAAEKLIRDPRVMAVVGPNGSDAAKAAAPVYAEAELAHINVTASAVGLAERYDTFFRVIPDDDYHAEALTRFAISYLDASTLGIVNDDTVFGRGLGSLVQEKYQQLDLKITQRVEVAGGSTEVNRQVANIAKNPPEVLFFASLEPEAELMVESLRNADVSSIFLGTDALKPSRFLVDEQTSIPTYQTNVSADVKREERAAALAGKYRNEYGEIHPVYIAEAYDAVRLIVRAICTCYKQGTVSRPAVLQALKKTRGRWMSGDIRFSDVGERVNPSVNFYRYVDCHEPEFLGSLKELIDDDVGYSNSHPERGS